MSLNKNIGARRLVVVHPVRRERADLEERRARVEQRLYALAREQLAGREVPVARAGRAALADLRELRAQLLGEPAHRLAVRLCLGRRRVEGRRNQRHVAGDARSGRPALLGAIPVQLQ